MFNMRKDIFLLILCLMIASFSNVVFAVESSTGGGGGGSSSSPSSGGGGGGGSSQYKTYEISESQLESGYTIQLSPGDKVNFPIGKNKGYVSLLSVYINGVEMGIFANDRKIFYTKEHPNVNIMPDEQKFEMTEDGYYDVQITISKAVIYDNGTRIATITLKKINEKIPEGTEIYYDCWKYKTCNDGTKIKYCDYSSNGMCGCRAVSSSECPQQQPTSCEKLYTCPDGKKINYCSIVSGTNGGGCGCSSNPSSLCTSLSSGGGGGGGENKPVIISETHFKTCSFVLNTLPYVNKTISLTVSVNDSTGIRASDRVTIKVVDGTVTSGGAGHSADEKKLSLQIIEPRSGDVGAGAVEIKLSANGPYNIGDMSLGIESENGGVAFPISNRNCIAGGSGGGGAGSTEKTASSTCEKYFVCPNGEEVQYCTLQKIYDEKGISTGAACGCKSNPPSLCTSPSSGGGGGGSSRGSSDGAGSSSQLPSSISVGGGGGSAMIPVICNGCILGDKCVPIGYRNKENYCTLSGEFKAQVSSDDSCNNSFECSSNVCAAGKCVSPGLFEKILNWFKKLFGDG